MAAELREETVVSYLRNHPHFLENYVTGPNISKETFHRWATRRSAKVRNDSRKVIGGPWLVSLALIFCTEIELQQSIPTGIALSTIIVGFWNA